MGMDMLHKGSERIFALSTAAEMVVADYNQVLTTTRQGYV